MIAIDPCLIVGMEFMAVFAETKLFVLMAAQAVRVFFLQFGYRDNDIFTASFPAPKLAMGSDPIGFLVLQPESSELLPVASWTKPAINSNLAL